MAHSGNPGVPSSSGEGILFGTSTAHTLGLLEAVMAETIGMAMHNAVRTQGNMQMANAAAVVATCARMLNTVAQGPPPPPHPTPPDPPPPKPPSPSGALGARIAQDTVAAETTLGRLVQDSQTASTDLDATRAALQAIVARAAAALPSPPPAPGATDASDPSNGSRGTTPRD